MRPLLIAIFFLLSLSPALGAERTTILEAQEQHGAITAHFSLSGTTLTRDASGKGQISPVDRLEAELTVESPESQVIQLPLFSGVTFGDFTLIEQDKISRARTGNIITKTSWIIEPYNPGEYALPELVISATDQDGGVEPFTLNLPTVQVLDLETADRDFDILPPRPSATHNTWLTPLLTGTGVATALALLILYIKRHKRPCIPSPKQRARTRLAELQGGSKEKTESLSVLIRQFLDENFNLRTLEKTYAEYEPFLKKHPYLHRNETLLTILKTCDRSNYSGTPLSAEALDGLIQQTHEFIEGCAEPLRPDEMTETCGRW